MISYLGALGQFSPAAGEGGALQADVAVYGEHSLCSSQAARSFGGLSPGEARLFPLRRAAQAARGSGGLSPSAACLFPPWRAARAARGLCGLSPSAAPLVPPWRAAQAARGLGALSLGAACLFPPLRAAQAARVLAHSPPVRRAFSLRGERPRQPEAWAPSLRVRRAFSLRGPSARRRSGLRKSLDRTRGLFAGWEGVASLGLSLPLTPPLCLPPPAGRGRLFSAVSQSLCFANHRQCVPAG